MWLNSHTNRTEAWLRDRLDDGFHIHHVDGDHANNSPSNLILIDGADHLHLHGMPLRDMARRAARGPRGPQKGSKYQRAAFDELRRQGGSIFVLVPVDRRRNKKSLSAL